MEIKRKVSITLRGLHLLFKRLGKVGHRYLVCSLRMACSLVAKALRKTHRISIRAKNRKYLIQYQSLIQISHLSLPTVPL
jgi:hypothetical protein